MGTTGTYLGCHFDEVWSLSDPHICNSMGGQFHVSGSREVLVMVPAGKGTGGPEEQTEESLGHP
jgi:hypothetical protein